MRTITILFIEDNTQDIRLINEMLKEIRSFKSDMVSAATLKDGCEQIQRNNFDIILLDLNLPDSTGQQTFQKVIDCNNEIPVVLITGNEDQELSVKLIMEGAQDYITKQSLNPAPLEKSILYSIERQALLRNIKIQNEQIDRIEKERILLAKFPSQNPDPVLRVARNGKLLYINEAGIKLLNDWQLIINKTIPSRLKDIIDPVFIEGTNIKFELCHREHIYSFFAVPLIEEGYINLYGRDITESKQAEEDKNMQKEILQRVFDYIPVMITYFNKTGNIEMVNHELIEKLGWTFEEWKTDNIFAKCYPDPETFKEVLDFMINKPKGWKDCMITTKYGTVINTTWTNISLPDGVSIGIGQDITERKQAEEALLESEEKFKSIYESSNDAIMLLNEKGFFDCNPQTLKLFGLDSKEEFITFHPSELSPPAQPDGRVSFEASVEYIRTAYQQGMCSFEWVHRRSNGDDFPAEVLLCAFNLAGEKVIQAVVRDITDRKRAEDTLRESKERLNFHINNSPLATIEWNTDFVVTRWSGEAEKIFGWNQSETIGKPIMDFPIIYDEDIPIVQKTLERLSDGSSKHVVSANRNYTKSRKVIYCEWYNSVLLNSQGKMISVMSQVMDITERKQAEETLDQERVLLRTIIDNFPNSIFVKDKKYRKIVVNLEHTRRLTAHLSPAIPFSEDDLLGKTDFEVYPRELAEEFLVEDQKILEGGQSVLNQEMLSIDANGRSHWELLSKIPLRNRNGEIIGLVGISNDITGRKRAEQALLQSEENFRLSISESPLGIRIISIEEETIYVNKAFLDIYEYNSLEEFISIPAINRYTPESYVQHQIRKEKIKNGHDIFDYEVSIVRENAEVRYVKVWRKEVLWNGVKHYQAFNLDITEQKQSEEALNNSQQELRKFATHLQNVREEEKIALAREIHDDLGQILVALKIDMGMFKKKLSKGIEVISSEEILSEFDDFSSQVDNTIKSARRIMNGLRPELIEMLGFEEACKSYLRDFDETHQINSLFESTIMNLNISLEQSVALFRILQEALNNIIKHAKAKVVKVQLNNRDNKLILEIIDNGVGFDENHKGRQDSYGLIGMKERVLLLDGELDITSKVGKGTSVRVEIPYSS